MKCDCITKLYEYANFCPRCGKKRQEVCNPCWVKNKPYNCGYDKCPGRKLFEIERCMKRESQKSHSEL